MVLMSAYPLTQKRRSPLSEVFKHWDSNTVYVVRSTQSNRAIFACSSSDLGYKVGEYGEWKNDTGHGYRPVPFCDKTLIIENIVRTGKCAATGEVTIVSKENNIGLNDMRAIYVFK